MYSNQPGPSTNHSNIPKSNHDHYLMPTSEDLNSLSYSKRIPILLFLDLPQFLCIHDLNFGLVIREGTREFVQFLFENFYVAIWNSDTDERSHYFTSLIFGEFKYELLAVLDKESESDFKGKRIKRFDLFFDASLITNDTPGTIKDEKYVISTERSLSVFQPDNTLFLHSQQNCNANEVKEMLIPSMIDSISYQNILEKLTDYLEKLKEAYLSDEELTIQTYIDENLFIP